VVLSLLWIAFKFVAPTFPWPEIANFTLKALKRLGFGLELLLP
jgi:hypothetical protein